MIAQWAYLFGVYSNGIVNCRDFGIANVVVFEPCTQTLF